MGCRCAHAHYHHHHYLFFVLTTTTTTTTTRARSHTHTHTRARSHTHLQGTNCLNVCYACDVTTRNFVKGCPHPGNTNLNPQQQASFQAAHDKHAQWDADNKVAGRQRAYTKLLADYNPRTMAGMRKDYEANIKKAKYPKCDLIHSQIYSPIPPDCCDNCSQCGPPVLHINLGLGNKLHTMRLKYCRDNDAKSKAAMLEFAPGAEEKRWCLNEDTMKWVMEEPRVGANRIFTKLRRISTGFNKFVCSHLSSRRLFILLSR